jgi:hypothetical protein
MKVTAVTMDAEQELETISVVMTIEEASAIVGLFGQLNGHAHNKLGDVDVYTPLWNLFVKFYEDGHPTGCPEVPRMSEINKAP